MQVLRSWRKKNLLLKYVFVFFNFWLVVGSEISFPLQLSFVNLIAYNLLDFSLPEILSLQRSDPGLGHVSRAVVLSDTIIQLGLFLCKSGAVVGVSVILHLGFLPVR